MSEIGFNKELDIKKHAGLTSLKYLKKYVQVISLKTTNTIPYYIGHNFENDITFKD